MAERGFLQDIFYAGAEGSGIDAGAIVGEITDDHFTSKHRAIIDGFNDNDWAPDPTSEVSQGTSVVAYNASITAVPFGVSWTATAHSNVHFGIRVPVADKATVTAGRFRLAGITAVSNTWTHVTDNGGWAYYQVAGLTFAGGEVVSVEKFNPIVARSRILAGGGTAGQVLTKTADGQRWQASGGGLSEEQVHDTIAGDIRGGTGISVTPDDAANTVTVAVTDSVLSELAPLSAVPATTGYTVGDIINAGGNLYELIGSGGNSLTGIAGGYTSPSTWIGARKRSGQTNVGTWDDPAVNAEFAWVRNGQVQVLRISKTAVGSSPPASLWVEYDDGRFAADLVLTRAAGDDTTALYAYSASGQPGLSSNIGDRFSIACFTVVSPGNSKGVAVQIHVDEHWELYDEGNRPTPAPSGQGSGPSGQAQMFGSSTDITLSQAQSRMSGTSTGGAPVAVTTTAVSLPQTSVAGDILIARWAWVARPGAARDGKFTITLMAGGTAQAEVWPIWDNDDGRIAWPLPVGTTSIAFRGTLDPTGTAASYAFTVDMSQAKQITGGNADNNQLMDALARRVASESAEQAGRRAEAIAAAGDHSILSALTTLITGVSDQLSRQPHIVSLWRRSATQPTAPVIGTTAYSGAGSWSTVPTGWYTTPGSVPSGSTALWRWTAGASWASTNWTFGTGIIRSEDSFNRRYSTHSDGRSAHSVATTSDEYFQDADPVTGAWPSEWVPLYHREPNWITLVDQGTYETGYYPVRRIALPMNYIPHDYRMMMVECRIYENGSFDERWRMSRIVSPHIGTTAYENTSANYRRGVSWQALFDRAGSGDITAGAIDLPTNLTANNTNRNRWGGYFQFRQASGGQSGVAAFLDVLAVLVPQVTGRFYIRVR